MVPSERFVTDITGWPAVNDKVLAAKGTKVEGEALRSGKRYIKPDGTDYKNKPRTRDQKATLEQTPVHPDSFDGRDHILQCGADVFEAFLKKQNETEETVWAIEKLILMTKIWHMRSKMMVKSRTTRLKMMVRLMKMRMMTSR